MRVQGRFVLVITPALYSAITCVFLLGKVCLFTYALSPTTKSSRPILSSLLSCLRLSSRLYTLAARVLFYSSNLALLILNCLTSLIESSNGLSPMHVSRCTDC